jgi:hypothetical protein
MDYKSQYNKYRNQYLMLKGGNDVGYTYSEIIEQMLKFIGKDKVLEITYQSYENGIFALLLIESGVDIIIHTLDDVFEEFLLFYYKQYNKNNIHVDKYEALGRKDMNVLMLDREFDMELVDRFKGNKLIVIDGELSDESMIEFNKEWIKVDSFNLMNYSLKPDLRYVVTFYIRNGSSEPNYRKLNSKTQKISISTDAYKFVYFDDHKAQREFITKHIVELLDMTVGCVPPNRYATKFYFMNIIIILKSYIDNPKKYKWYFVTYNDRVIGFCQLYDKQGFVKTDEKIKTYSKYCGPNYMAYYGGEHKCEDGETMSKDTVKKIFGEYSDDEESERDFIENYNVILGPVINSLCKNKKYKDVGAFLLNNLSTAMAGKHQVLYLIPESLRFKDNEMDLHLYDDWGASCVVDKEKYIESTNELIKYYEKQGFNILKDTYLAVSCSIKHPTNTVPPEGTFMFYNVLYKKLNSK